MAEAKTWRVERDVDLSQPEREFILAGQTLQDQERFARERNRRRVVVGLASGLIIAVSLALLTGFQWFRAEEQRGIAEDQRRVAFSRQLSTQALNQVDNEFDLALLLGSEALVAGSTAEAKSVLMTAIGSKSNLI